MTTSRQVTGGPLHWGEGIVGQRSGRAHCRPGGLTAVPAAKLALLDAAVGTKIILDSNGGLVNRRNCRAFSIVADRMRVEQAAPRGLTWASRAGTESMTPTHGQWRGCPS